MEHPITEASEDTKLIPKHSEDEDEEQIVVVRRKKRPVISEATDDTRDSPSSLKKTRRTIGQPNAFIEHEAQESGSEEETTTITTAEVEKEEERTTANDEVINEDQSLDETERNKVTSEDEEKVDELEEGEEDKSESGDEEYEEEDDDELDEEDLALIEENLGLKISRPRGTHLRRLKKGKRHETGQDYGNLEPEHVVRSADYERAREELQSKLFAEDEEEHLTTENVANESRRKVIEDDFNSEEDDLDDFIVADEDDEDEDEEEPRFHAEKRLDEFRARKGQRETVKTSQFLPSGALGDAFEIFGDGSDYAHLASVTSRKLTDDLEESDSEEPIRPTVTMEETFEPSALKEKYFTNFDEKIRMIDIPERIQLRDMNRGPPEEGEIEQEALWMAHMIIKEKKMHVTNIVPPELIQAIVSVLRFMRHDYLEVPFIAHYRKEFFVPQLTSDDLWYIYDADETWKSFYSRKLKLLHLCRWLQKQSTPLSDHGDLETTAINTAFNEDELTDQYDQLRLFYGIDFIRMKSSSSSNRKQLSNRFSVRDFYHVCKKAGLHSLAQKFGISAQQLGSNLAQNRKLYEAEDPDLSPIDLARQYVSHVFPDPESVLRAARMMLAEEIATEPKLRKFLRNFVRERTLITVRPTEKGRREIDEFHKYTHVKYLSKKPFHGFDDAQFLELEQAEQEGSLELTFELDPEGDIFAELRDSYCKEAYSSSSEEWNTQRTLVLKETWDRHLRPFLERYLRNSLNSKAIQFLKRLLHRTLSKKLMSGPFSRDFAVPSNTNPTNGNNRNKPHNLSSRIFAISWLSTDPESVTFGVVLNEYGDPIDHLRLTGMRATQHSIERQRKQKELDLLTIRNSLEDHLPRAIVIGPGDMSCRRLFDEIRRIVDDLIRDRILTSDTVVTFVDDEVAKLYQNTDSAILEFPDYPPLLRYTISLGRRFIDPLLEYACLCNTKNDILSLKLHPLQTFLSSEIHANMITRAFVDAVNAVGVDINRAVTRTNYAPLLQFVAGLGPRKAQLLIKAIRRSGRGLLEQRQHLVSKYAIVGPRVYRNAASFLRVSSSSVKSQRVATHDVLDNTRIHPEDYELARKMATDALEIEEEAIDDEDHLSQYVEEIIKEPAKLNDLLLEDYAKELEKRSGIKKHITLQDIRNELQKPFVDPRPPFEMPTADEKFRWLSLETDFSLHPGLILPVTVIRVHDRSVGCRLDSGLYGMISLREMVDGGNPIPHHPSQLFHENQVIQCRVLAVHTDRFSVDLSVRPSELDPMNRRWEIALRKDRYYDWDLDRHEKQEEKNRQAQQKDLYVSRMIHHPLFKNMTFKMAEEYLEDKQPGDLVIRPSSKGPHHLTLSWKVADHLIQHMDILEKDKDNEFTLGKSLYIDQERFDDLDEVIARHIEPLTFYLHELSRHKNFRKDGACTRDQLADILHAEKLANPARIPYYLALSKEFPGKAVLAYQSTHRVHFEEILITSSGLKLADQLFTNVDSLVNWFKQHHQNILRPVTAAAVPLPVTNIAPPVMIYSHPQQQATTPHPHPYAAATAPTTTRHHPHQVMYH